MEQTSKLKTYTADILHEGKLEHPVEFNLVVFKDILKTALGTVLVDKALVIGLNAGTHEMADVVVVEVLHLKPRGYILYRQYLK